MNDTELDRVIDRAAADMIEREPSAALRHRVMARVRESDLPAPRRFVWATVAVTVMLCAVVAIFLITRRPVAVTDGGITDGAITDGGVRLKPDPTSTTGPDPTASPTVEPATPAVVRVARRRTPLRLPVNDLSAIEAITMDPLVLSSIDLPPLENPPASVERLEIEALTIEPLTASND